MNSAAWTLLGSVLAMIGTVAVAVISARQSRRNSVTAPYDALAERVVKLEGQIDSLRAEVQAAKTDAHESRAAAEQAVAENIAWVEHHLDVVGTVAAIHRPWPTVPGILRHRLSDLDYPPVPVLVSGPPAEDDPQATQHLDISDED